MLNFYIKNISILFLTFIIYGCSNSSDIKTNSSSSSEIITDFLPAAESVTSPQITPETDQYSPPQKIEITSTTEDVEIFYTIDGTIPSGKNGIKYSSPFIFNAGATIKAIAVKNGLLDSDITTKNYTDEKWWLKLFGGDAGSYHSICAAATDINNAVYITGFFSTQTFPKDYLMDFNPGYGTDNKKGSGIFITKIESNGTYAWTRILGNGQPFGITTDSKGNVYITGFFSGTSNFNSDGSDIHTSRGYADIFISKINADGSYGWTRTIGGESSYMYADIGRSLAVDSLDNIYITGAFSGDADFDFTDKTDIHSSNRPSNNTEGEQNLFIMKINSDGSYGWTVDMGSVIQEGYTEEPYGFAEGISIKIDSKNNIYISGRFSGFIDFNPYKKKDIHASYFGTDIFITRINNDGSYSWTKTMGSTTGHCSVWSLSIDKNNNLLATGEFTGKVNFNTSGGKNYFTSSNKGISSDAYILKINSNGKYLWCNALPGIKPSSITTDSQGNAYLSGSFYCSLDFDPGLTIDFKTVLSAANYSNIFLTKFSANGSYGWTEIYPFVSNSLPVGNNIGVSVNADRNDKIFLSGIFTSEIDFNPVNSWKVKPQNMPSSSVNSFIRCIIR